MGDKDQSDGNHTWRAATLQENQKHVGEATRSWADLRQVRNSLEDRFIRMRREAILGRWDSCLTAWGHKCHSVGMGRSQGMWMCLGRTQGGQTCGHFGVTGNLSLLFSHNGEHCGPAPTVPFCKPVLSFQEKENLLFCPAELRLPPTLQ